MRLSKLAFLAATVGWLLTQCATGDEAVKKQVMELRTYTLKDAAAADEFDKYAEQALLPALNKHGIKPVGAFTLAAQQPAPPPNAPAADNGSVTKVMLLLPASSADAIVTANAAIAKDETYQKSAADYLATPSDRPLISRISSELLVAFDSWPDVKTSKSNTAGQSRLYELRTYESPSEHLGNLKVEMFNSGEVPIFLDCGIQPVFMGQAVVGSLMPNLTYMTVYDNAEELAAGWKRFAEHPEWKKLREVKKYIGTVSKIHKSNWETKSYSQL